MKWILKWIAALKGPQFDGGGEGGIRTHVTLP